VGLSAANRNDHLELETIVDPLLVDEWTAAAA
jgi:hypothetical protein